MSQPSPCRARPQQMLVRALLYRLGPTGIFARHNRLQGSLVTHVQRVRPVIDVVTLS